MRTVALKDWILSSPRRRLIVFQAINTIERSSEEIRRRANRLNPNLNRVGTQLVLKDFVELGLVESEIINGKLFYCLTEIGKETLNEMSNVQ